MIEAIQPVMRRTKAAGIRVGLHNGTIEYAAKVVGRGLDLVKTSNDVRLPARTAQQSEAHTRKLIGEAPAASLEKYSGGN